MSAIQIRKSITLNLLQLRSRVPLIVPKGLIMFHGVFLNFSSQSILPLCATPTMSIQTASGQPEQEAHKWVTHTDTLYH